MLDKPHLPLTYKAWGGGVCVPGWWACSAVSAAGVLVPAITAPGALPRSGGGGSSGLGGGFSLASSFLPHVFSLSLLFCVTPQALGTPKEGLGNEAVLGRGTFARPPWSTGVLAMPLLAAPEYGNFSPVTGLGWFCVWGAVPGSTP